MTKLRSSLMHVSRGQVAQSSTALVKKEGVERVVAVIDHSGSMSDAFTTGTGRSMNRMDAVIEAIHFIVDSSSRATSQIGLIGFSSSPEVLAMPTDRFSTVKVAAMSLRPTSSTHYGPALQQALALEPDRIILLSDGEASDKEAAISLAHECKRRKVKIDTVGIGDEGLALLKQLAEMTDGVYMFADNFDALQEAFGKLETRARFMLEHQS